jgi:YesN/AraC family two-component response regulator
LIKLLIVDDYPTVREILREFFHDYAQGISVVGEAANGREAIDMAEQLQPDVILMDISMPVMDGLEATRALQKRNHGALIFTYTSYQNEAFRDMARAAGAIEHFTKPFDLEELWRVITAHIMSVHSTCGD